jgi:hypothetical protein
MLEILFSFPLPEKHPVIKILTKLGIPPSTLDSTIEQLNIKKYVFR